MRPLSIAVVGCGTAGPAAALHFARAGHAVDLYEKVAAPGPVGAGIVLQPIGQLALGRLGLWEEIQAKGARIDGLRCSTAAGAPVVHIDYADVHPALFGLGLHRGALFGTLFAAVQAQPGIRLHLGVEGLDLRRKAGRRVMIDGTGQEHGPFDLIVVADGAHSQFRDDTPLTQTVRPYPYGALWFITPEANPQPRGMLRQVVEGTTRLAGLLPSGHAPKGGPRVVSLFWSLRADQREAFGKGDLDAWKRELLRYFPDAGPVAAAITQPSDLLYSGYRDVVMRRWATEDVVYIGDSAHAMSPQLGQGANLALVDADVLADCVAQGPTVAAALDRYSRARRRHLDFYQFMTRWLTPFFQSDLRPLGPLRDLGLRLALQIPWVRRQMVETMVGMKQGLLRASMPLPLLPAPR